MVHEGIILGHLVSERGIEVDKAKIEVIEQLPPPMNIRGIHSFLVMQGSIDGLSRIFHKMLDPS